MQEKQQKTYTLEDNVKSIYFQNRDILKAIEKLTMDVASLCNKKMDSDSFDGSQF